MKQVATALTLLACLCSLRLHRCHASAILRGTDSLTLRADTLRSSVRLRDLPSRRSNWFNKITFSWANSFMTKSRTKPIELSDLWKLDGWDTMSNISSRFHDYVAQHGGFSASKTKGDLPNHSQSILKDLWSSPLVQILAVMYCSRSDAPLLLVSNNNLQALERNY